MAKVRIREPHALYDVELEAYVTPMPSQYFEASDPLVKQYPWAFATDAELVEASDVQPRDSVTIEQATAAPGEKRATAKK